MKLKHKILFILFCFVGLTLTGYSQVQRKMVIDSVMNDPDIPILVGTTMNLKTRIHMTDSANNWVSGSGNIRYYVQSDSMYQAITLPAMIEDGQGVEFVPAGGRFDTLHLPLDSLDVRLSETNPINVIIIWPSIVNPSIILIDSGFVLMDQVFFTDIGLPTEGDIPPTTIYPNPSGSFELLYIKKHYTELIEQISIIDYWGQPVFVKRFTEEDETNGYVVPTFGLATGIYSIQIQYKDKKMESVKYIKN